MVLILPVCGCASVILLCMALVVTRVHAWRQCPECAAWEAAQGRPACIVLINVVSVVSTQAWFM